jgi:hypothetical protein
VANAEVRTRMARPLSDPPPSVRGMLIDCSSCTMRDISCGDCVVSVLLGPVHQTLDLTDREQAALAVLSDSGMVPPLRLVPVRGDASRPVNVRTRRRRSGSGEGSATAV